MTMLRPKGKALKIAKEVIPGFDRNKDAKASSRARKEVPNDAVEMKIVNINEKRGYA